MTKLSTYTLEDLRKRYENATALAKTECRFATEVVGGITPDRKGVEAFVRHHLRIPDTMKDKTDAEIENEIQRAIDRIVNEETGTKNSAPDEGEIPETLTYGIHVIRRDDSGRRWLGDWMVKACLKAAASRLGLWVHKRGSKGDMVEMGQVRACGISLLDPDHPERIYLIDGSEDKPVETFFQQFKGKIQTGSGPQSIVTDCECAPAGTRFAFTYRFGVNKISPDDVPDIFALAMVIGLGSNKSFERGKFSITKLDVSTPEKPKKAGLARRGQNGKV